MDQSLFVVEIFLGCADGISGLCAEGMCVWVRVRAPVCILLRKRVRLWGNLCLPEGSCLGGLLTGIPVTGDGVGLGTSFGGSQGPLLWNWAQTCPVMAPWMLGHGQGWAVPGCVWRCVGGDGTFHEPSSGPSFHGE